MGELYGEMEDLLADLESDIKEVLMDEVLDTVKKIEVRHVKEDVFDKYKPKIYERRLKKGIDDPENIVGEVYGMELTVDNVTQFNDGYGTYNHGSGLPLLVNDGDGAGGYYYDYPGEFSRPRPFVDYTVDEIESTDTVENALAKGLKKRAYDIE